VVLVVDREDVVTEVVSRLHMTTVDREIGALDGSILAIGCASETLRRMEQFMMPGLVFLNIAKPHGAALMTGWAQED
jgi:hypothetical protein